MITLRNCMLITLFYIIQNHRLIAYRLIVKCSRTNVFIWLILALTTEKGLFCKTGKKSRSYKMKNMIIFGFITRHHSQNTKLAFQTCWFLADMAYNTFLLYLISTSCLLGLSLRRYSSDKSALFLVSFFRKIAIKWRYNWYFKKTRICNFWQPCSSNRLKNEKKKVWPKKFWSYLKNT